VVEASVWWKRSERSGNVDTPSDLRIAIVPPRIGREVSVPHIVYYALIVCDVNADADAEAPNWCENEYAEERDNAK